MGYIYQYIQVSFMYCLHHEALVSLFLFCGKHNYEVCNLGYVTVSWDCRHITFDTIGIAVRSYF